MYKRRYSAPKHTPRMLHVFRKRKSPKRVTVCTIKIRNKLKKSLADGYTEDERIVKQSGSMFSDITMTYPRENFERSNATFSCPLFGIKSSLILHCFSALENLFLFPYLTDI